MNKTIFITGASSGIGKETALFFSKNNWNVIAASRNIEKMKQSFGSIENIYSIQLDVRNRESIDSVIKEIIAKYQIIDVLVNNAGFALTGIFEYSKPEQIRKQFETNVFGLMDISREIIPIMRKQGFGTIINISSIGGLVGFPSYSMYQATKFAIEGFSESLSYELQKFNINVKLIEPGIIQTNFYTSSMEHTIDDNTEYKDFTESVNITDKKNMKGASHPILIAKCIYKAANDKRHKLRYHAGKNSNLLLFLRKFFPDFILFKIVKVFFNIKN